MAFKIILDQNELLQRGSKINRILEPIRGTKPVPWKTKRTNINIILYACDDLTNYNIDSSRFKTKHNNVSAVYYEIWYPVNSNRPNEWFLERCYLNVFLTDRKEREEHEFICIHADPEDKSDYKRAIHLHIKKAEFPISKAHIALNLNYLELTYKNSEEFFSNFNSAIKLVVEEILSNYE